MRRHTDVTTWPLDELVDFVVNHYHEHLRVQVPLIERLIDRVVVREGAQHPALERIAELFRGVGADLVEHMDLEERVLFPYLRTLAHGRPAGRPRFGPAANPIASFEDAHRSAAAEFQIIRMLADRYHAPHGASPELRACYDALDALDRRLQEHMALEEDVLFPAAIEAEGNSPVRCTTSGDSGRLR